ncbi:hypothetical protein F3Y22_tig00116961pilonHSYRG00018 [Hibiscus syriacus]|uniref:EF-hand domain-containing protein n=1 Tax=Hibiscus syriacus TaxID=106335 RepID=A0A6A2WXC0_HIBSY|nr:hypothetical protein F3Y22_tig00116961pilonHSYRG00018 [Hibiscus syriacus]
MRILTTGSLKNSKDNSEYWWGRSVRIMSLHEITSRVYSVHPIGSNNFLPQNHFERRTSEGIQIDDEELARFVEHVDKDSNGIITFEGWRDFLLLYPHEATIENIYHHWERVCHVDIGEQAVIPQGISKHVKRSKYFIAGGLAGAASRTATAPLDRLKVVLQVQTTRASILPAVKKIWKEDGVLGFFRGDIGASGRLIAVGVAGAVAQSAIYPMDLEGPRAFYKGLVPSLLEIIPYAGIELAVYETLKDFSRAYILEDKPGPLVQLGCGTISGALGATCVYPLQVIRTRLHAQCSTSEAANRGMSDVFWRTFLNEGCRDFYKGLCPNLLKVVPAASITYMANEAMKKSLDLDGEKFPSTEAKVEVMTNILR